MFAWLHIKPGSLKLYRPSSLNKAACKKLMNHLFEAFLFNSGLLKHYCWLTGLIIDSVSFFFSPNPSAKPFCLCNELSAFGITKRALPSAKIWPSGWSCRKSTWIWCFQIWQHCSTEWPLGFALLYNIGLLFDMRHEAKCRGTVEAEQSHFCSRTKCIQKKMSWCLYQHSSCHPCFAALYWCHTCCADESWLWWYGLLVVDLQMYSEGGSTVDDTLSLHDIIQPSQSLVYDGRGQTYTQNNCWVQMRDVWQKCFLYSIENKQDVLIGLYESSLRKPHLWSSNKKCVPSRQASHPWCPLLYINKSVNICCTLMQTLCATNLRAGVCLENPS